MAEAAAPVELEGGGAHPAWDAFVERAPGGHHVQSSLWGEVKRTAGWEAVRILVRDDGEIVAGCQVLLRSLGPLVAGYVTRGPLALTDTGLAATLDGVTDLARRRRVLYLKVQPPVGGDRVGELLDRRGFVVSGLAAAPTATVLVDLERDPAELLAAMRPATRRNIRTAARKGVTVRMGDGRDLADFYRMVDATSRRQGFPPYPRAYYEAVWRHFSGPGRAALVIAEHRGAPLSALLLLGYGDTVVYKMGGWSGDRNGVHPNEAAHWAGMGWARDRGYRFYDLEGIDRRLAENLVAGNPAPSDTRAGVDHFKLGFGGAVVLLPMAHDCSGVPGVSGLVRRVAPGLDRWEAAARRVAGRRG
jgi:lipid II:glycine glycyltransferase (peptidoglycan interpeptide bridge formation enzyme)